MSERVPPRPCVAPVVSYGFGPGHATCTVLHDVRLSRRLLDHCPLPASTIPSCLGSSVSTSSTRPRCDFSSNSYFSPLQEDEEDSTPQEFPCLDESRGTAVVKQKKTQSRRICKTEMHYQTDEDLYAEKERRQRGLRRQLEIAMPFMPSAFSTSTITERWRL